jgi:hypothetical protein
MRTRARVDGTLGRFRPALADDRRGVVSVTSVVVANEQLPESLLPGKGAFVDRLVAQLSAQYGVDPGTVRTRAAEVLASFAGARVQSFVPVLVEKRLRETFRAAPR